jgi:hypothetical protein
MGEPATTTSTAVAAATSVPSLLGMAAYFGLHPGLLVAGAFGSFVAMVLLNTAPEGSTILKRLAILLASSLTAGYLTPLMLVVDKLPESVQFATAFVTGGSAQWLLLAFIRRFRKVVSND